MVVGTKVGQLGPIQWELLPQLRAIYVPLPHSLFRYSLFASCACAPCSPASYSSLHLIALLPKSSSLSGRLVCMVSAPFDAPVPAPRSALGFAHLQPLVRLPLLPLVATQASSCSRSAPRSGPPLECLIMPSGLANPQLHSIE